MTQEPDTIAQSLTSARMVARLGSLAYVLRPRAVVPEVGAFPWRSVLRSAAEPNEASWPVWPMTRQQAFAYLAESNGKQVRKRVAVDVLIADATGRAAG